MMALLALPILLVSAGAASETAAPLPGREGAEGVVWLQSVLLPPPPRRRLVRDRRLRHRGGGCYCSVHVLLVHNHRRGPCMPIVGRKMTVVGSAGIAADADNGGGDGFGFLGRYYCCYYW